MKLNIKVPKKLNKPYSYNNYVLIRDKKRKELRKFNMRLSLLMSVVIVATATLSLKSAGNELKKENTVIGFVSFGKCDDEKYENYGEIKALYILEGFKGQGFGRALFERAREELNKIGFNKMRINCLKGNPSLDFYIHMGGKVIGEFENSILGPGVMEEIIIYD